MASLFAYAAATRAARDAREAESSMAGSYATLSPSEQQALHAQAEALLHASSGSTVCVPSSSTAICLVHDVLTHDECAEVVAALRVAAGRRGGWGSRHHQHATADMGVGAVPPELEALLRARLFACVLQPLAGRYFVPPVLPESLRFNDIFFVTLTITLTLTLTLSLSLSLSLSLPLAYPYPYPYPHP